MGRPSILSPSQIHSPYIWFPFQGILYLIYVAYLWYICDWFVSCDPLSMAFINQSINICATSFAFTKKFCPSKLWVIWSQNMFHHFLFSAPWNVFDICLYIYIYLFAFIYVFVQHSLSRFWSRYVFVLTFRDMYLSLCHMK